MIKDDLILMCWPLRLKRRRKKFFRKPKKMQALTETTAQPMRTATVSLPALGLIFYLIHAVWASESLSFSHPSNSLSSLLMSGFFPPHHSALSSCKWQFLVNAKKRKQLDSRKLYLLPGIETFLYHVGKKVGRHAKSYNYISTWTKIQVHTVVLHSFFRFL